MDPDEWIGVNKPGLIGLNADTCTIELADESGDKLIIFSNFSSGFGIEKGCFYSKFTKI